jgi:hypothetical protein
MIATGCPFLEDLVEEALSPLSKGEDDFSALTLSWSTMITDENEGLAEVWQTPMAGFFTYGEFGRVLNGKQNFHSGACCWVTLKEK